LNRYDGNEIVVFKNDPNDEKSISDNYITYIQEDKNKNLWVGTINGLNRFDERKNSFIRFKHEAKNPKSISDNYINGIKMIAKTGFGFVLVVDLIFWNRLKILLLLSRKIKYRYYACQQSCQLFLKIASIILGRNRKRDSTF